MNCFQHQNVRSRQAMTLIEIIAAVALISIVGFLGMRHVQTAGTGGQNRACELNRQMLQNEVDRYQRLNRTLPSSDLRELVTPEYLDAAIPVCPVSGSVMRIDRNGDVVCPTHPSP
jgi:prepilin-type N-terminal cleavage/methylation domain-containing protein